VRGLSRVVREKEPVRGGEGSGPGDKERLGRKKAMKRETGDDPNVLREI
jgi:hypothetical protein